MVCGFCEGTGNAFKRLAALGFSECAPCQGTGEIMGAFARIGDVGFKKSAEGETVYEGGARRDSRTGKGSPEWMPRQALALVSCIYEAGNIGRSTSGNGDDRNWENGMKIGDLLGSALRHIERYIEGDRSEAHLPQAVWNLLNAIQMGIWTSTGYRSKSFNNLADHIHTWKPGDPAPPALSSREVEWLKLRGIDVEALAVENNK